MKSNDLVMREMADYITATIGSRSGFCLLVFDFGEEGRMNYASNANRHDVVAAMKEFIAKMEGHDWGTHDE